MNIEVRPPARLSPGLPRLRPPARAPRPDRTLRLLLVGAVALPLLLLALWGWWSWTSATERAEEDAQRNAALVREYAQRVVQTQERTLDVAASLLAARPGDTAEQMRPRLAALTAGRAAPLSVVIADASGTITAASGAAAIGLGIADRAYFAALRDGAPEAVQLERQRLRPNGQDALLVAKRRPGEGFSGVIVATVPIRAFTDFFGTLARDPLSAVALLHADGRVLVGRDPDMQAEPLPDTAAAQAIATADAGLFRAVALDGVERIHGFTRVEDLPVVADFGLATATLRARWLHDLVPVAALLLLASGLGYLAVNRSIHALRAEGDRRRADAATREARRAADLHEALLGELHHRVKNCLAMVLALTRLRPPPGSGDNRGADRALEQRVFAIAKVHDLLHVQRFRSRMDVGALLNALCTSPAVVPPGCGVPVVVAAEPVEVDVERATPLALIAVELISNALRHGFPGGRRGRVEVLLQAPAAPCGPARLVVRDNGIGLPEAAWPAADGRSGLGLVARLASQARATVARRAPVGRDGLEWTVSFPAAPRE